MYIFFSYIYNLHFTLRSTSRTYLKKRVANRLGVEKIIFLLYISSISVENNSYISHIYIYIYIVYHMTAHSSTFSWIFHVLFTLQ